MKRLAGLFVVLLLTLAGSWGIGESKTAQDPIDGGYWSIDDPEI
ncbi:hypothetical protein VKA52_08020 [Halobacillus sp. HZG1]|nr:hypothetical protein [Halobacillus sp. HZG1]MEC3883662.1 hypothetical protein [Halobacillus sp. HZG1]